MNAVGRDHELAAIASFFDAESVGTRFLMLEGEPGIGKTTLWRAGIEKAEASGYRVLSSSAAGAETQLAFTSLRDLLSDAFDKVADELPSPQRHALAVALLREDPGDQKLEQGTIAVGLLSTLGRLVRSAPILLAVDDVHWMDAASAAVLRYALRRLTQERIAALFTRRRDALDLLELDRLERERLSIFEVGPLSLGATGRILNERLGVRYARPTLHRVHEASGGNPFYSLELARALGESSDSLPQGAPLPVPTSLRQLVEGRLVALPRPTLDALAFASALSRPTVPILCAALGEDATPLLEPAIEAHVVDVQGHAVNFVHPLFAAAVYSLSSPRQRSLHARLAEVVADDEERVRHLALAIERPDAAVATALDDAAQTAAARGALDSAAALAEQAIRFTPDDERSTFPQRQLAAAEFLARAGSRQRAREVINTAWTAATGPDRARVALGLAWWGLADSPTRIAALEEAVLDAQGDARLLAQVHALLGCVLHPEIDVAAAEHHAALALELAERVGDPAILVLVLSLAEHIDFYAGRGVDLGRIERALELEALGANAWGEIGPTRFFRGHQLLATGELDAARSTFEALAAEGEHRGDSGYADVLVGLAVVEAHAGNLTRAQQLADDAREIVRDVDDAMEAWCHWPLALVAAMRGDAERARAVGTRALELADRTGSQLLQAHVSSALGLLELSLENTKAACSHLYEAARLVAKMRLREPGLVPFVPDLVETLVAIGEVEAAEAATAEFEEQARRLAREVALAGAARCRGLILASRGDLEAAVDVLEAARRLAAGVGQPFELARALLALGTVQRRARQKRAARETLNRALSILDQLGAKLWAEKTWAELGRIGGRAPSTGGLTPTERRIADLVAEGKTNKEVASVLVVADRTVESALTQIYRKLDVRSRTELAHKLSGQI